MGAWTFAEPKRTYPGPPLLRDEPEYQRGVADRDARRTGPYSRELREVRIYQQGWHDRDRELRKAKRLDKVA